MKINNVGIIGIGSYTPEMILTNSDIDSLDIGTNADWTKEKLGIEQRHVALDEKNSDLAYFAALKAIKDGQISVNNIDLIILATSSPDRISPSTATIVGGLLGVKCPSFDINAVCSGFIYGMQLASNLIDSGQYKNILLIGSEKYSNITNWESRDCVFFGDGAGAVIISNVNNSWISTDIYSDGTGKEHFTCKHGENFQMDGNSVYDFATKILPQTIKQSLEKNKLTSDNISWLIPHQPSINILKKTAKLIGIPEEKVVLNMMNFANTAGASIPMALDKLYSENKLKCNDILVMPAVGSGWTWGVSIIKYQKKMKKIIIFGGTGGLGTKIIPLLKKKYEVISVGSKDVDVTDLGQIQNFLKEKDFDIVLNFTGKEYDVYLGKINKSNEDDVNNMLDVNIKGNVNILAASLPTLINKKWGRIISISSILSEMNVPKASLYSASKAFVDRLMSAANKENIRFGVTCNSIQLGYWNGGMCERLDPEFQEKIIKTIGLRRWGSIDELYETIVFMINNEYICGTNLRIDGGI